MHAVARRSALAALSLMLPLAASAQRTYTTQDYTRAQQRLAATTDTLVQNTVDTIQFLPDGRVFYAQTQQKGSLYFIADPAKKTTAPAFDKARLTKAISAILGWQVPPEQIFVSGTRRRLMASRSRPTPATSCAMPPQNTATGSPPPKALRRRSRSLMRSRQLPA